MIKKTVINLLSAQPFRYLIAAGIATFVDVITYFIFFNYILSKQPVSLGDWEARATSVSLIVSFSFGLVTNFLITKLFVFPGSSLRNSSQFLRFLLVAIFVFLGNFYFMDLLIDKFYFYPTIARGISAIMIGVLSFITHKAFSFRRHQASPQIR